MSYRRAGLTAFMSAALALQLSLNAQNPLAGNQGFHIITEGNFTSNGSHHIHGPLAVGGNLIINNGSTAEINMDAVGSYVFPGDGTTTTGLLVGGGITWTSGALSVLNNKYIHIGSSTGSASGDNGTNNATQVYPSGTSYNNAKRISATIDQTPSPAIFQTLPLNIASMFSTFNSNSQGLSNCTSNVQLYNSSTGAAISGNTVSTAQNVKITSLNTGVNHLKLTTTSLSNITEFKFEGAGIPSSTKILVISVNISANYTWQNCNMSGIGGTVGPYILWNFYGASTYNVTINTASLIIGTVFAPMMNLIKTGTGDIDGNLVAKTIALGTGEIHHYPFVGNTPNCCVNLTSAGTIAGDQSGSCGFDPVATTSSSSASGGSGTLEYGWDYSINGGSTWSTVTGATSATYNPPALFSTTKYRRKARRLGCETFVYSNIITITITGGLAANAGSDISQCENAAFILNGNTPGSGQTSVWSVVSGTVYNQNGWSTPKLNVNISPGTTATLRYTVTAGSCVSSDDVIISNTTGCSTACVNPLNQNGDIESEGTATNFNLTFNSTPALLITSAISPSHWAERYGGNTTSTSSFNGAFYLKKTGTAGDPHSGSHMIYLKGSGFCLSALTTNAKVTCGKTYKFSVWIAAFSNAATQSNAPFALEHSSGASSTGFTSEVYFSAPASTSWNDLNWQRYEFTMTIPSTGFSWADFYFTSISATNGILIDDVCITEVSSGSTALAGLDQFGCSNSFTLSGNTVPSGYTGTWSVAGGSATIASPTSSTSQVTITSGSSANLKWTVTNGSGCSDTDKVTIGFGTGTPVSVNSATICQGGSATLTASGCSSSLTWSTGATTPAITVNPASIMTYTVTCTPSVSSNLVSNSGFESATNFQNWSNWANAAVSTVSGEYRSGSKGAKINASTAYGGFGQDIAVIPGESFTISFWAKSTNFGSLPEIGFVFFNSSWAELSPATATSVFSSTYTKYTLTGVAPPTSAWLQIYAQSDKGGYLYVDDVEVYKTSACSSVASSTVTVSNATISLGTPTVSACLDQPLMDVATVSIAVSWTNAPAGDKIKVTHNNKTEYIDVAGGVTSPQIVIFLVPANGTSGNIITASWQNTTGCSTTKTFTSPAACNASVLDCSILYILGSYRPADGGAWDNGFYNYLTEVNGGTTTRVLAKADASGMGFYDPANGTTPLSIDINTYKTIIISPTTQSFLSNDLKDALKGFTGGILNMNIDVIDDLGYTSAAGSTYAISSAVDYGNNSIPIYNYDNISPTYSNIMTGGNYKISAIPVLWSSIASVTSGTDGVGFQYRAHSISGISTTHGTRVFLGIHMDGLYANVSNGGAVPAPSASYFHPTKHLTQLGKLILDQAIVDAVAGCSVEICNNATDDDGDGLEDCADPDCGLITNPEFDNTTSGWTLTVSSGNAATLSIDRTSQLSGLNAAKVNVSTTQNGTESHVRLSQMGKTLYAGTKYTITFTAKASTSRTASIALQLGASPNTTYFTQSMTISTATTNFTFNYTPTATISNISFHINLGKATGNIWVDNVQIKERCEVCNNGLDDDGDGFVDALDPDCTTCDFVGQNLVTNGEFEDGNTGFVSDYIYTPIGIMCATWGIYGIGSRVSQIGVPLGCSSNIWSVADRANTGGNFMLIDPSFATGISDRIWSQTIPVCANTDYVFSMWTKNMYYKEAGGYSGVDPNFQFSINNVNLPGANFVMPRQDKADSLVWVKVQGEWNSGSATSATLKVVNMVSGNYGNDIAIDGVFFGLCGKKVEIAAPITTFCDGNSTFIQADIETLTSNWTFYEWLKDGVVVSSGPNQTSYTATAAGVYKLRAYNTPNNSGCPNESNSITISVISRPVITNSSSLSLCVGATTAVTPTSGGTWTSSNSSIATITNTGVVTAIAPGTAYFTFTQTSTGCLSLPTATLTVNADPTVTLNGGGITICSGGSIILTNTILGGTGTTSYQWQNSTNNSTWFNISGATSASYTTPALITSTYYRLSINQTGLGCGSTTSAASLVTIVADPSVSISGGGVSLCSGGSVALTSTLNGGTGTPAYQWQSSTNNSTWINISGANSTTYSSPALASSVYYRVTLTMSGVGCGANNSTGSLVTIYPKPVVTVSGPSSICIGSTTQMSPSTGGTWQSSNPAIATITNTGMVTGITAGSATFVFTSTTTGCISDASTPIQVNAPPQASACLNFGGSFVPCISIKDICDGESATMMASATGSSPFAFNWDSGLGSGATKTVSLSAEGQSQKTNNYNVTVSDVNGCTDNASVSIIVHEKPPVSFTGPSSICQGSTTTLSPTSGGTWTSSDAGVATVSNAGLVTAVTPGIATFTFTNSLTGCTSVSTNPAVVGPSLDVSIDFNGSLCLQSGSTLTAVKTGGTAPFVYNWTGPNGFSSSTSQINVMESGNYLLTITDAFNCVSSTSGTVHPAFIPAVSASQDSVCNGESVQLTANGTQAITFSWGGNGGNADTSVVSVTPTAPFSTYIVTVTNDMGCTSTASSTVYVYDKPIIILTGPDSICQGTTTQILPSIGGTWASSNPTIADISNDGYITGLNPGTVTFIFTKISNGCSSDPSVPFDVLAKPDAGTDPAPVECFSVATFYMSASGSGTWSIGSGSPGSADIVSVTDPSTEVSGFTTFGSYELIWTNVSGCSDTVFIQVNNDCLCPITNNIIDLPATISYCVESGVLNLTGQNANPVSGIYEWEYSLNGTAFTPAPGTNNGQNYETPSLGVGNHKFRRTYTTTSGVICTTISNPIAFVVKDKPNTGEPSFTSICIGQNATLTPTSGGTWSSSNAAIATVTNSGVITGISSGSVRFAFVNALTGCTSDSTSILTVNPKPTVSISGSSSICQGSQTTLSPTFGGVWTTNNAVVATVDNNGVVYGVGIGSATFTFTSGTTGCISLATLPVNVNGLPSISIDFHGSVCLTDTSKVTAIITGGTPPFTYNWTGPSFSSTLGTIDIGDNGSYYITVTDINSCSATENAFIYERFDPIVVSLQTNVCEGTSMALSALANNAIAYQWSANAGNSTQISVNVIPIIPSSTYYVTVTNNHSCTAAAFAEINVMLKPQVEIIGSTSICIGGNSYLSPGSGGVWASGNVAVANVDNEGVITGLSGGLAKFVFTDSITGCKSDSTDAVVVGNKPIVLLTGPSEICVGAITTMSPASGGIWTSSDTTIAVISNNGTITGVSEGAASFVFQVLGTNCTSDPSPPVTVYPKPIVTILGQDAICIGQSTLLSPNAGGTWVSSQPTVASISPSGVVSSIHAGLTTFIFTDAVSQCVSDPSDTITVYAKPVVSIAGDSILCVGETSPCYVFGRWHLAQQQSYGCFYR
ncbi:MAG: choice-of-anchor A family protein [Saprospiraceae bacterium]|nr:choice-of-anchor A family protein [Saprospiraceae bacterium]